MKIDMSELVKQSDKFRDKLAVIKKRHREINWYPYHSMANIGHIEALTPKIDSSMNVLDIGPADGDIGYLFESLGCAVDFLDNAGTNYNDCRGIKCLKTELKSPANILEKDVDWQFVLQRQYDLAIALGIFYHLRNPMSFLMRLALHSQYLLLSTRVCQMDAVGNRIADQPLVYFLDTRESNDDPTNYWIFTQVSLKRVLKRSGWNMVNSVSIGETRNSDPIKRDERMFVYCQRVPNWVDLTKHHDF